MVRAGDAAEKMLNWLTDEPVTPMGGLRRLHSKLRSCRPSPCGVHVERSAPGARMRTSPRLPSRYLEEILFRDPSSLVYCNRYMRPLILALSVVYGLALPSAPTQADQDSPRLPSLFEKLGVETDPVRSIEIERRIWRIWGLSKNQKISGPFAEGVLFMSQGDLDTARQRFNRVVSVAPDFAEGWNKRATVAYLQGDFQASIIDIKRTLDLEPRHFGALSGLSLIYEALGEEVLALDVLVQVKEIYPAMIGIDDRLQRLRDAIAAKRT